MSLLKSSRYKEALPLFTTVITDSIEFGLRSPEAQASIFCSRSRCYAESGNFSQALVDAQRAISIQKDYSRAYIRAIQAFRGMKRFTLAQSIVQVLFSLSHKILRIIQ